MVKVLFYMDLKFKINFHVLYTVCIFGKFFSPFSVSVLVGLYEEPEKPNNALEYPLFYHLNQFIVVYQNSGILIYGKYIFLQNSKLPAKLPYNTEPRRETMKGSRSREK